MMRIAQISDLHVRRASDKAAREVNTRLAECVAQVNAVAPDVVIATGDLVESGCEEEYRLLRQLMDELRAPYYLMPGNHDDPRALRRVYADHRYLFESDDHVSYTINVGGLMLIMLDSTKKGRAGGYVDAARLGWLNSQLCSHPHVPTLLALHHPPFAAGVWPLDWLGFTNVRELETVVRAHSQIRRVVSGHVHCTRTASWGGTFACTSPSTRPQSLLVGFGWQRPKLHFQPAGFLLHAWSGCVDITSYVHCIHRGVERLRIGS